MEAFCVILLATHYRFLEMKTSTSDIGDAFDKGIRRCGVVARTSMQIPSRRMAF